MDYRHIIPISGKDSAATALVQLAREPDLPYEFIFNDTFAELPEVDNWLKKMEDFLNAPILRIGENLEDIIYDEGILPSRTVRFCTRKAKIFPMEDYIAQEGIPAKVYFGLRYDEQQRVGYQSLSKTIQPVYPLQETHITLPMVYDLLDARQLAPPDFFWQSLYDMVLTYFGLLPPEFFLARLSRAEKAALFTWRSRMNCYYCFFQQIWEWVGLLEYHPALFDHAEKIENEVGGEGYTWRQGWPLAKIRQEAEAIKLRRAKRVFRLLMKRVGINMADDGDEETDGLLLVSCGLLCGK